MATIKYRKSLVMYCRRCRTHMSGKREKKKLLEHIIFFNRATCAGRIETILCVTCKPQTTGLIYPLHSTVSDVSSIRQFVTKKTTFGIYYFINTCWHWRLKTIVRCGYRNGPPSAEPPSTSRWPSRSSLWGRPCCCHACKDLCAIIIRINKMPVRTDGRTDGR